MKKFQRSSVLVFGAALLVSVGAFAADPVPNNATVNVIYQTPQGVTLSATGGTGALSYSVESQPAHGSLSGTAPNLTYTPNPSFDGTDTFSFLVQDTSGGGAEGTITLNVGPPPGTLNISIDGINQGTYNTYQAFELGLSSLGLAEGVHTASIDATDTRGGHAFASIHFTVDNTAPSVAWELFPGYPNHPVPSKGTIAMKVFVQDNLSNCPTDDNIDSVRLIPPSGPQINFIRTQDCGHYAYLNFDTRGLPDGLSTFGANATDRAGNLSGTTTYATIIDNTPPTNVTLVLTPTATTINSDAVIHGMVSISGSATDATSGMKTLKLFINSGGTDTLLGTFTAGSFSAFPLNTAGYGDGNATLRVEAYDQIDNMASTSQAVVIDNAGPTVAITSPVSGATGLASLTEVLATASDLHAISLRKIQIKPGAGSFTDRSMTFTAPDHWTLTTPLDTAGTYTIRAYAEDGIGNPGNSDVTVTISGANHAPTAADQPVSVVENVAKPVTLTASDPDNDPLSYIIVTPPAHGTLSGAAPALTYTPSSNYFGADSFTFKANDGAADSNVATVSLTVSHVNQKPTVTNGPVTTSEDTPVAVTLTGSDPDSDPLSFRVTSDPANGTVTGTLPDLTYTPDPRFSGSDSLTVVANDGAVDSDPKTIMITVNHVNHPPVADNQSASTSQNTAKSLTLTATDADGDLLTYIVVAGPAHGALSGAEPNVTYTPDSNFSGADSFTFKANDGTTDGNVATVSVTVNAVNQTPTANGQSVSTNEDASLGITLVGTDPESATLSYEVTAQPSHGTLAGTAPNLTYAPGPDYNGSDSFSFRVNDGQLYSSPAAINITVNPVNDAPVANDQNVSTALDTALPIALTGADVDGDALTFGIVTGPTHGSLSGTAPNITYTPTNAYSGADKIVFSVSDGHGGNAEGLIRISVGGGGTGGNSAPAANAQSVTTGEDAGKDITLTGSDPDGDPLSFIVIENPKHGTLSGSNAARHYEPDANYNGSDSFRFKVNDGLVDSVPATVSLTVTAANDAPVADAQDLKTDYQTPLAITLTGSDVDGDGLSFATVGAPAHGLLSGAGANITYTPNSGFSGNDSFTFKANDGTVDSALATIRIAVNPQGSGGDNAPTADAQSPSTNEDAPVALTLTGSDPDGDPLTFIVLSQPTHGSLSGTGAGRTYTPESHYHGADSFRFKVNDGTLDSPPATISLTVNHVNHKPVADGQTLETAQDTAVVINFTGSDVDGDALTFTASSPSHGSFSGSGVSRTYTPNSGYNGVDSFTLKANDGSADSDPATIRILVGNALGGGNRAPTADAQSASTDEDTAKAITLTGSDLDGDPLTYAVVGTPLHGTLSGTGDHQTYTPYLHYQGADSFTFKVNDGFVDSALATVSLTVAHVNHAPTANDNSVSTLEGTAAGITLTASDIDNDALTFTVVSGPSHGTLSGSAPNVTYTPNANYHGADSFTFKANDGTTDSNVASVSVTVVHVNHPPAVSVNPDPTVGNEDTSFPVTLQATDADGDTVNFILLANPANGSLSGAAPNLTYTPNAHFHGTDSFIFKGNDGQDDSAPFTAHLTVNHVNHAPVANNGSSSLAQNNPRALTLSASDVDGDALTYVIVSNPAHGSLSGAGANRTYTPSSNYTGADSFTFKANDGTADSNVATFSLTIVAGDNPPVAQDQSASTQENTAKPVTLVATDPDAGTTLTYSIVTQPAHGALSGTAPNLTYTPTSGYSGSDVFTFKANDGTVDSNIGTVSITVTFVNQAPTVSVTSPVNNAYVRHGVAITAVANDDVSVSGVDISIDGGAAQPAALTGLHTYTLNWNSDAAVDASHVIQATARDGAGLTRSDSVTVVVDRTAPGVSFTPSDAASVAGTTNIQAAVTDDRALSFAEILIDGTQVTSRANLTGTSAQINYSWNTLGVPDGNHTVAVHAVDAAGNETSTPHVIGVHNLGGGNPAPDFDVISPAANAYAAGIITLHGKLTVGTNVSVGYTVDGLNFTAFTPAAVNVGDDFTGDLDTTALAEGSHIIEFVATDPTVPQPTRKDVTIHVDNTPPTVTIDAPTTNGTIFLVSNLQATALDPNGVQLDEVRFSINGTAIASRRPGNSNPADGAYSFLLDTSSTDVNGNPVYPDSPIGVSNYSLTVTAWNKARVPFSATVPFRIDNAHIPTNPAATFTFNPTDFVWGSSGHDVWCRINNATIDGTSFNQQGSHALEVKVKMNSGSTWQTWTGPLRLVNNTIYFDRSLPANCRYQLTVRVMDTTGKLLQSSVEGIMAIDPSAGGTFATADGTLSFTIPAGALTRPMYLEAQLMTTRPPWMQAADASFNQVYPSQRSVAGPFQLAGLTSMTSDWVYNEHLNVPASLNHRVDVNALPTAEKTLLRQIQNLQTNDGGADFYWHPLGTSNNQGNVNFRSVDGTSDSLGIYRVTSFAPPGSGISDVFNYPNPFHPNDGPTSITYMLGDNSDVTLVIYDALGNLVLKEQYGAGAEGGQAGLNTIPWSGRNGHGDTVASGAYIAQLLVKDVNGGHFKAIRKIGVVR